MEYVHKEYIVFFSAKYLGISRIIFPQSIKFTILNENTAVLGEQNLILLRDAYKHMDNQKQGVIEKIVKIIKAYEQDLGIKRISVAQEGKRRETSIKVMDQCLQLQKSQKIKLHLRKIEKLEQKIQKLQKQNKNQYEILSRVNSRLIDDLSTMREAQLSRDKNSREERRMYQKQYENLKERYSRQKSARSSHKLEAYFPNRR